MLTEAKERANTVVLTVVALCKRIGYFGERHETFAQRFCDWAETHRGTRYLLFDMVQQGVCTAGWLCVPQARWPENWLLSAAYHATKAWSYAQSRYSNYLEASLDETKKAARHAGLAAYYLSHPWCGRAPNQLPSLPTVEEMASSTVTTNAEALRNESAAILAIPHHDMYENISPGDAEVAFAILGSLAPANADPASFALQAAQASRQDENIASWAIHDALHETTKEFPHLVVADNIVHWLRQAIDGVA